MFSNSATNLLEQTPDKITRWLNTFDTVISDCDGVIWNFGNNIEGSIEALNRLKEKGKKIFYCTNNSTQSRQELTEKARKMGLTLEEQDMICTSFATAAYLKSQNFNKRAYIVGPEGLAKEFDAIGIAHSGVGPDVLGESIQTYLAEKLKIEEDIGAVVVGRDEHISFPKMMKAGTYLVDPECLFLVTNRDERYEAEDVIYPETGSLVATIELLSERCAHLIGKPNPDFCATLLQDGLIEPCRTLIAGDNLNTDILLGKNCGFQTMLVGTGISSIDDVNILKQSNACEQIPDVFLPRLGDLLRFL